MIIMKTLSALGRDRRSIFFLPFQFMLLAFSSSLLNGQVERFEILERELISEDDINYNYESISGRIYLSLDPELFLNQRITDVSYAPRNAAGLVDYSVDFRLLVPSAEISNGGLIYHVNNRGGSRVPPQVSLSHPLTKRGFSYLVTGWINELSSESSERLRLHAPIISDGDETIKGKVRYEIYVYTKSNDREIGTANHLAYRPTEDGLIEAVLTKRAYQKDNREEIDRDDFTLTVIDEEGSSQPRVTLNLKGGFEPGVIYELIYEAQDPVLAGVGMAAIRDIVSLMRYDGVNPLLGELNMPEIDHTIAWGNSQSGRLLRHFVYDGFNIDLSKRRVFDGVIPVITGAGYGMFNNRFAMPTRTNGHHTNYLYPNDLFPFTYGDSVDPFTGSMDGLLSGAREEGVVPKVMHIQTSNEYWLRAGSLPHTNPLGTEDAVIPDEVRFYTIGGSAHTSRDGKPRAPTIGRLSSNPNMWAPIAESLVVAMSEWISDGIEPPASRYPLIANNSLVRSHVDGKINQKAWNPIEGIDHPSGLYRPEFADYGAQWNTHRIIESHPPRAIGFYNSLVPAVDINNNDLSESTILPPTAAVPIATFLSWNLRAENIGAPKALARLVGGYLPLPSTEAMAAQTRDPRGSISDMYQSFEDYFSQYELATDDLISQRFLLPEFKRPYMDLAGYNARVFDN
ncbi:alpha/beta hydrolase domain-containing protein [bacterium]|nr:alpha/beta hydrolase domain-containing protein [bacterium]MDA9901186.1 alpha/beta hydrolase domain-containing protein [Gammaproteobacteria bacterium]